MVPPTPTRLAMAVTAVTVVVAVPCVLHPLVGPWTLLWIPAVLLMGALYLRVQNEDAPDDGAPQDPDTAPGTTRGTRVRPVALPSAVEDYDLVFSAVVHWQWDGHVDLRLRHPVAPAVLAIVTRAAELARGVDPADHGMAECELAARLAVETAVTGTGIVVWAEDVALRLPEDDVERLRSMARIRKDRELREAVRDAEEELEELRETGIGLPSRSTTGTGLDAFEGRLDLEEDGALMPSGPGSDVDVEGYESYWWPAEGGGQESVEHDVQVAILRGMIASLPAGADRAEFARAQVEILERGGFGEVARRVRAEFPDLGDGAAGTNGPSGTEGGS
ncbi:hypothetical protein [Nocardiopsis sp. ATB16-24]|uniref:hypothetical protein n=1 Tax=Nocardiopsis sp. ATB16-24 TaxID=3019555 RepID=UPI002552ADB8|nr:hypothetical protein [Nocardiopsis sp. ATB16-24]